MTTGLQTSFPAKWPFGTRECSCWELSDRIEGVCVSEHEWKGCDEEGGVGEVL